MRFWQERSWRSLGLLALLIPVSLGGCANPAPFQGKTRLPPCEPVKSRFLHQDGRHLVGPDGNPKVLRAMNLGGWLHWESWMFGGGLNLERLDLGSESQLLERFEEYYGADAARRFQEAILDRFVSDEDLKAIAQRGFDAIRLPLNHTLLENEEGWRRLRRVVDQIGAVGLGVILDLHAAPGGQSKIFTADPDPVLLWDDPEAQAETVAIWERIAREYKDDATIVAYDLLNEPAPDRPEQLLSLYRRILTAIRRHDPEHLVLIEGPGLSRTFDCFTTRLDPNMAYSPHVYLWVGWPDKQWQAAFQKLTEQHHTPVWIGEFGEDGLGDIAGLRVGFEQLAGWAVWSWKRVGGGATQSVNHFAAPPAWTKLIRSIHPTAPAKAVMSEEEAFDALDEFLIAAQSYAPVPGMKAALGR